MKIIFYDIPSRLPLKAWSPNTWKTRYCLNFKGLPYQTEWVEYPDIEPLCKKLGVSSARTVDGTHSYTLPAIHDPSTGVSIANSFDIAEYLDKTYPNTPLIFPHNTAGLQAPFALAFGSNMRPLLNFLIPTECEKLNPRSSEYFRRTRERTFGKKLEDLAPQGPDRVREWAKVERGLGKADAWLRKNGGSGPFMLGTTPCWADFVIGGYMAWIKSALGEESEEWKDIASWHDGRWKMFIEGLKKYENVV
ncbi:hypothetical protein GALMADRAFT_875468 [Galerina marginata CBS 339.88]|uniref:GST N-terminal domain-containing protein n=1 Tax=Galerina marginata (strain CBS 339.88) TaxID=685588 RepID=A0A067TLL8_GALM3|nr:hypothetical protein GALMADRAFT_875468 [Galerina marginata CBS 339.88]